MRLACPVLGLVMTRLVVMVEGSIGHVLELIGFFCHGQLSFERQANPFEYRRISTKVVRTTAWIIGETRVPVTRPGDD